MGASDTSEKNTGGPKLSAREGFAAIALAAIASDGNIRQEEVQRAAIDLSTTQLFRDRALEEVVDTLKRMAALVQDQGVLSLLQAAKASLDRKQMEAAFFMAADLVLTDSQADPKERQFLKDLQGVLEMDEATGLKIMEAVRIKNQG